MSQFTRNSEDSALRRRQILEEALRVVGELGYHGFTIQGLAKRCSISNAGLLYYFGSKDKLLLALLDEFERRGEDRVGDLVVAATEGSPSRQELYSATIAVLHDIVAHVIDDPVQARFVAALQLESMNEAHPAHRWFQAREEETLELFTRLASPWVTSPLSTARHLYALMNGLSQQWLRSRASIDLLGEWGEAIAVILPAPADG